MSGCRRVLARLFQTRRPATDILLSPNRVLVLGTMQTLALAAPRVAGDELTDVRVALIAAYII